MKVEEELFAHERLTVSSGVGYLAKMEIVSGWLDILSRDEIWVDSRSLIELGWVQSST